MEHPIETSARYVSDQYGYTTPCSIELSVVIPEVQPRAHYGVATIFPRPRVCDDIYIYRVSMKIED